MRVPLGLALRKRQHLEIAQLQDEIAETFCALAPKAVLHGGTAIWRCFQGVRFSEDLDFYAVLPENFKELLAQKLSKNGLILEKFKQTENSVFSKIASPSGTEVKLEIALRKAKSSIPLSFEKTDGSSMIVFSLSAEDLLVEKINAFQNRRLIRDLFDVFFLSSKISDFEKVRKNLASFLEKPKTPIDEKNLKTIVYSGIAPSGKQMLEELKKRLWHEIR